ncbi:hypothetical protein, partial [Klebsiella pneumoniae]|uniref:hypothetical protein n=1 Tax=Klebsiella pneumoniae TaxID=573 RepID=UPI0036D26B8F
MKLKDATNITRRFKCWYCNHFLFKSVELCETGETILHLADGAKDHKCHLSDIKSRMDYLIKNRDNKFRKEHQDQ